MPEITVWKIEKLYSVQILREINVCKDSKSSILIFQTLNFEFGRYQPFENTKINQNLNSKPA